MKKIKILIITICIIITILLISIIFILNKEYSNMPDEIPGNNQEDNIVKELRTVTIRNDFFVVKTCIEKFYNTYSNIYDDSNDNFTIEGEALESIKREQQSNINAIYNMLDKEYIAYANITKDNIENKLQKINQLNVEIDNMYVTEQTENIYVYFVYGNLLDINKASNQQFSIIVKIDKSNKTFKMYLSDYVKEKFSNIKENDNIQFEVENSIKNDADNVYEYKLIDDETYAINIFNTYLKDLLYNRTRAYKTLNSEYSVKKFNTQQEFEKYISKNLYKIATMQLDKYQKSITDNYTQYICIDKNNNYYIFRETSPMNYTVILDTYTIDLPEFIEKYESASDEEKVLLNLQKCFEAINNKDYNYVYNKLDETFKANNFATLEKFEEYIKKNTFDSNAVTSRNAKVQGNVYMYDLTISDKTGKNTDTIKKTFLMQLKEGTDFVMSFGI